MRDLETGTRFVSPIRAIVFLILAISMDSASAEYYLVYPASAFCAFGCGASPTRSYHHYYRHRVVRHPVYRAYPRPRPRHVYREEVYRQPVAGSCNAGACGSSPQVWGYYNECGIWVPETWRASPCHSPCQRGWESYRAVPPSYDPDMRTGDDIYPDLDIDN